MTTGSPLLSNPTISKNATHVTLMWSPPFLWPGHRIQYYNISMTNKSNGSIFTAHYTVDISITNPIVTVSFPMSWNRNILYCMGITCSISPIIDGSSLELEQTFSVTDWAWTFHPGKPCFKVNVKLPIC